MTNVERLYERIYGIDPKDLEPRPSSEWVQHRVHDHYASMRHYFQAFEEITGIAHKRFPWLTVDHIKDTLIQARRFDLLTREERISTESQIEFVTVVSSQKTQDRHILFYELGIKTLGFRRFITGYFGPGLDETIQLENFIQEIPRHEWDEVKNESLWDDEYNMLPRSQLGNLLIPATESSLNEYLTNLAQERTREFWHMKLLVR